MSKCEKSKYLAYISNTSNDLSATVEQALDFIQYRQSVKTDSSVYIKPNFTFPYPAKGVTTSPELLKILLEKLSNRCQRLIVGESDGGSSSFSAERAFEEHGMYKICKDAGADLVNLSKLPTEFIESTIQGKKVKVLVPKMLLNEVDCSITVPTLKVHVVTTASLGIKNLWGCYPDTMRCLHHQNLACKLTLLAKIINPKITLIDGLYGLNNHGPMYGTAVKTDLLIASNNVVVADTLGVRVMGLPLRKVKHIRIAEKEGLGTCNLESVQINTEWKQYAQKFRIKKTLLDNASMILVKSDLAAKIVMDSALTPLLYGIAGNFRSKDEQTTASYLSPNKRCLKKK
jgi:uncharacterized protein (DUF362 family)